MEEANDIPGFVIVADGLCGLRIEQQPLISILDPTPPPRVRAPLDDARGPGTRGSFGLTQSSPWVPAGGRGGGAITCPLCSQAGQADSVLEALRRRMCTALLSYCDSTRFPIFLP